MRFFAGRVEVFLRAMGLGVADDQILAWADLLGPLRAHMFPLKGGGLMTVSAAEELLQEQLVAHGAILASAKTTATYPLLRLLDWQRLKRPWKLKTYGYS